MSRPTRRDEAVIKYAAEKGMQDFKSWLGGADYSDAELLNDLCAAIRYDEDGFQRAKELDRKGYTADSVLVEIMDGIDLYGAEQEAVAAWVKEFDVKPPFPVGAIVNIGETVGEITNHDMKHGKATVFVESAGHVREGLGTHGLIIAWEKLQLTSR